MAATVVGKVRWYKRDPTAALEGMACLTLEERGAYNTVLDLIYSHDGKVDDDERFLAGWLRVDVRVWKRIRSRLIGLEKLYTVGGYLRNARADRVVDEALARCLSASQAGLASAAKSQERRSLINGLASTSVQRTPQLSRIRKKDTLTSTEQVAAREAVREGRQQPSAVSRQDLNRIFEAKRLGDQSATPKTAGGGQ